MLFTKIPEGEKTKGGGGTAVLCLLVSLARIYFTLLALHSRLRVELLIHNVM